MGIYNCIHGGMHPNTVIKKVEPACKPGSVEDSHSSRAYVAVRLKRPTREQRGPRLMLPYLVLLRVGFTLPPVLPQARCALTAPFHPYRRRERRWRYIFCGTGRGLTPPRRYLALCPMEPGLSSMPKWTQRLSSRLASSLALMARGRRDIKRCRPASTSQQRIKITPRRRTGAIGIHLAVAIRIDLEGDISGTDGRQRDAGIVCADYLEHA